MLYNSYYSISQKTMKKCRALIVLETNARVLIPTALQISEILATDLLCQNATVRLLFESGCFNSIIRRKCTLQLIIAWIANRELCIY